MEGYRFLVCCVLVLTIYELEGVTATVTYQFNPITESKNDIATPFIHALIITVILVPSSPALAPEEHIDVTFTVKSLNEAALTITTSDKPVTVQLSGGDDKSIVYHGNFKVFVTTDTEGVLTGDLSAELSCSHLICKGNDKSEVIVKETKSLSVTATATHTESQATDSVTVTLSKDLATSDDIKISVSLHNKDPQGQNYSSEGEGVSVPNPGSDADSSIDVVFHDIQWGEYQLIIDCGDDSVCLTLSQRINFPEPVSVSAHPSYSQLAVIIVGLKKNVVGLKQELAAAVKNTIPSDVSVKNTIPSDVSVKNTIPSDVSEPASANYTRYVEFAVGGLIAVLVCGLLIYYRARLKEWICSKKAAVSNLPKNLRRNVGSKYTNKLPRTMQEAMHQD